jgi:hypothetical protein
MFCHFALDLPLNLSFVVKKWMYVPVFFASTLLKFNEYIYLLCQGIKENKLKKE